MSKDYHQGAKGYANDRRYAIEGLHAGVPTTASTQGAGALGVTAIRVNETSAILRLPGITTRPDLGDGVPERMTLEDGVVVGRAALVDHLLINAAGWVALNFERTLYFVAYYDMLNATIAYATVAGTTQADQGVNGTPIWPTAAQIRTALDSDATHL
ncbi:MAG: hypothetical protein ABIL09_00375, partial [Gemmatimonadota bacterium]